MFFGILTQPPTPPLTLVQLRINEWIYRSLQIYFYMPSLNSTEGGKYPTMIPAGHFEHPSISYIDLDLPPANADNDNDVEESAPNDTGG